MSIEQLVKKFPQTPGVYIFRDKKRKPLYIGKATSLRARVMSYLRSDLMQARGPLLVGMIESAQSVDYLETDSVLEALILEASLIKKHQPIYNTKEKDNKSFNYVVITDEAFPRILTMRGRELEELRFGHSLKTKDYKLKTIFGPFPQGSILREALSIVRKIFPFRDKCIPCIQLTTDDLPPITKSVLKCKPCFNAQINLCPGVCAGTISKAEYAKIIRHITLFFEGKKKALLTSLEREMKSSAKKLRFEEASRIKKTIFALNHIQDVALIKERSASEPRAALGNSERAALEGTFHIEAYDVAHISGTNVVGVMVVMEDGEPKKSDYRKFKIKTSTDDDNASLREMLTRRLAHPEWPLPDLIVVDGGIAQIHTAENILGDQKISIPVVGVVKDEHHKPKEILGISIFTTKYKREILLANNEAHRFAIGYHRQLRGKIN